MADPISRSVTRRVETLRAIEDPETRASAAATLLRALEEGQEAVRAVRDDAAVTLLRAGKRQAEVARLIGTTRGFMAYFKPRVDGETLSA